jgi:hypothetical protein
MKRLVPAGAVVAAISFFLPYVQSPDVFGMRVSRSGADLGGKLWIVFLAPVAILAAQFLVDGTRAREKRMVTLGAVALGYLFLGLGALALFSKGNLLGISAADMGFKPGVGAFGSAIGLTLALIGELSAPSTSAFPPVAAAPPTAFGPPLETPRYTSPSFGPALEDSARQLKVATGKFATSVQRDLPGWMRRHRRGLTITGAAAAGLLVVYEVVKPRPGADGARAALAFAECQQMYGHTVNSTYGRFLRDLARHPFHTRSEAEQGLENLFGSERRTYDDCAASAEQQYASLAARYPRADQAQTFLNAFSEKGGRRLSAGEIESADAQQAQAAAAIQAITAPVPDSNRIVHDLVGQQMAGWNFAYVSEFKGVSVVSQRRDGDDLILRTNLALQDYITKAGFKAILDLKYRLGNDGEWNYNGFTELLYTDAGTNFLVNGQIFLVGKWRWRNNYATYNPDGTWYGRWDDGTEARGNWAIVSHNLVLTRNGSSWVNIPIVQVSPTEFTVQAGTDPAAAERAERVAGQ